MTQPTNPLNLPWCTYPTADDSENHGIYSLPTNLPIVDFAATQKFRSYKYVPILLNKLDKPEILELIRIISNSFAVNEPMNRHVHPPRQIPKEIIDVTHQDVFGNERFGTWTTENILFWFIRLVFLIDPSHLKDPIQMRNDMLLHSLVITDEDSKPIGGSLNVTLLHEEVAWRKNDPFLKATFVYQKPIIEFLHHHEHIAVQALSDQYPNFKRAHQSGKVGYIAMIARSPELPSEHTFELFVSSFENFQKQGYEYMLITGSNQWTGAACEALGAARIYFAPFRDRKRVAKENDSDQNEPFSKDGFISGKDSGLMIYALKL